VSDPDEAPRRFGPAGGDPPPDATVREETLMRYLDGELGPGERERFEELLEGSTELQRELAVFRMFHHDLAGLRLHDPPRRDSVWDRVHRRLSRPIGWVLLATGSVAWLIYMVYLYLSSTATFLEKAATSAVIIGILLLFASVIHDRYREWLTDPYRNVER